MCFPLTYLRSFLSSKFLTCISFPYTLQLMFKFSSLTCFEWDIGNFRKNPLRHGVTATECEEAFLYGKRKLLRDRKHSLGEMRFILLGKTTKDRVLFIVFTFRSGSVRVISARDINRKEHILYEKRT
jgi:uncharacterized DUF497 family protein